ncbi:GDP-Man:Man(3)GlcNAc(2)-PP-Dol alpha-1,2-mannosyltransferase [Intoshia linei]|uniref:GDP-Man:Man(3)GlcNAc(2)-PP-Dol alpha-1,2-mannosyltransferase n=1 Tax=Intoshia linei TaxID=1819745 RepID=A0A177BDK3_9BILA|nr:GDP-Man:Man(3)GlcNAc(2)-PP-Dol alpha-1,2-mannosyltransferase [Intoshia linei]
MEFILFLIILTSILVYYYVRKYKNRDLNTVAFFHPDCLSGGGGERVLWVCISSLIKYSKVNVIVYCDQKSVTTTDSSIILEKVKDMFGIEIVTHRLTITPIHFASILKASNYPVCTLLFQTLASILVSFNVIITFLKNRPNVIIDTSGYSVIILSLKFFSGMKSIQYVHYPFITDIMIGQSKSCENSYNHSKFVSSSSILRQCKHVYLNLLYRLYSISYNCSLCIFANGTWTYQHLKKILHPLHSNLKILYPPVPAQTFISKSKKMNNESFNVIYVAQFRLEKNHLCVLEAWSFFIKKFQNKFTKELCLKLVGGAKIEHHFKILRVLKEKCIELNISKSVQFLVNLDHIDFVNVLISSNVSIHAMKEEHFGIGIVESMAAGVPVIAHNSGGPKLDIICENQNKNDICGKLAVQPEEYAECLFNYYHMNNSQLDVIISNARNKSLKFDDNIFIRNFIQNINDIFNIGIQL